MHIDLTKTQQYLEWLKEKLYLNSLSDTAKKRTIYRGQIYYCKFGMGIGSEESKERPCVILQYDSANKTSPNTLVAPITHSNSTLPTVIPIKEKKDNFGSTVLDGNVLLGNITCISKARLGNFITELTKDEMKEIDTALAISLDLYHHYKTLHNMHDDKLEYIKKLKEKVTSLEKRILELSDYH